MKLLIVRNDKLGDFITTLPAISLLKSYNSDINITVLVAPINAQLAAECSFIDSIMIDNSEPILALSKRIKKEKFDASITMFSNTRVGIAQFLAGIKTRIAPATKLAQVFYNKRVTQRRSHVKMSEYEYNIELAQNLYHDIKSEFKQPLLEFDKKESIKTYKKFTDFFGIQKEVVAFHVGFGGSSDANWSLEEYFKLIDSVLKEEKYQVVMTFGPDEDTLYNDAYMNYKHADVILYQSLDGLVEFAKLLSHFKLFVSTSTGTYHLAALVGCETMTFFGDSLFASVKRWKAVSLESLQHAYMLPQDTKKRAVIFEQVQDALKVL